MMLRPQGYATVTDPDGVTERDTFTCVHCCAVKHVKPRERPEDIGGLCKVCMGLICADCVGQSCIPFMKKLERMEARYHARRSYLECA
jgi:hypothetical protein